jgi:nucleoside-diphosphate-sugar epimerase
MRDFTFIDDIARGTILAMKTKGCEVFNFGAGNPVSILRIIALIESAVGKKAVLHCRPKNEADMEATWADNTKARGNLGWEPKVSVEEGINKTVEWHMKGQGSEPPRDRGKKSQLYH